MHEFRRNHREGIDVPWIDDVQFLAGTESTQDELISAVQKIVERVDSAALHRRAPSRTTDVVGDPLATL